MSVIKFFNGPVEEDYRKTFKNGTPSHWNEMPDFIVEEPAYKVLSIEFDSESELNEFYDLVDYTGKWGGENSRWKPNIRSVGAAWFPAKDLSRNSNLRFVHMETYLENQDKYELVSLDAIKK